MISKPVPARSFYHTCRYIAQKQGAEVLLAEGVRAHDYKLMAADFELQQQLRPTKSMACFHSILSFYPGEKPSDEMMKEIAKKYLEDLGIVNTQYAVSKHTDKAHLHMHIVANMVNNEGRAITDSFIGLRGKKIAQRLTQEYKLIPALEKNLKLTHLESLSELEATKYKIFIAVTENLPLSKSMNDLEKRLMKLGIETQYKYKGQTNEKQGVSFRMNKICFKGSQVDRKYSFTGLQKIFDLQQKQVLMQEQKLQQLVALKERWEKVDSRQTTPTQQSEDSPEKELSKIIKGLLRPEPMSDSMPKELTQSEELKRKKKKKLRIRH